MLLCLNHYLNIAKAKQDFATSKEKVKSFDLHKSLVILKQGLRTYNLDLSLFCAVIYDITPCLVLSCGVVKMGEGVVGVQRFTSLHRESESENILVDVHYCREKVQTYALHNSWAAISKRGWVTSIIARILSPSIVLRYISSADIRRG